VLGGCIPLRRPKHTFVIRDVTVQSPQHALLSQLAAMFCVPLNYNHSWVEADGNVVQREDVTGPVVHTDRVRYRKKERAVHFELTCLKLQMVQKLREEPYLRLVLSTKARTDAGVRTGK